ncbi:hypothetical protein [Mesorhizobium amorphae]|uniref:hypothetical protein n=1 Tax=Mesorhizobium amorphae TaxID=71433 RepID=UPI003D0F6DFD
MVVRDAPSVGRHAGVQQNLPDGVLVSPKLVRPYVKANKRDDRDAEAATPPTMRFVPVKSEKVWWRSAQRCSTICALFG